jgi:hypothetical protein
MSYFETPRGIKNTEKIFACIELLCMVALAIIFGAASCFIIWLIFNNVWLACLIALIVFLFFLRIVWKGFLSHMCFSIQFYPDHLQIGRGLACCRFPYELVEMITVQKINSNKSIAIEIECLNKEVKVYLSPNSLADCVSLLCNSCKNAIYIDICGKEYLPIHTKRPDFILKNLRNHYLGRIIAWTIIFFLALFFDIHTCVMMYAWMHGKFIAMDLPFLLIFLFLSGAGSVFSLFVVIRYIKKLKHLSCEIKKSKFDSDFVNNTTIQ